jgi:hypothetical protein
MRTFLALTLYLAILAPGITPAAYPAPGPVTVDRDPFPLNRTELQGWEFRPSFMSCGAPGAGIALPHYWKDTREGVFSREIIIPGAMKGRAVFFQAVADTGGEIFLDGVSRGSFGLRGRLLLTGSASGGEKYHISVKSALEKPFGVFTDASLIDLDAELLPLYRKTARLRQVISSLSVSLAKGWKFNPDDDPGFSAAALDDSAWTSVTAPHRDVKSFSWSWYRNTVTVPSDINGRSLDGAPLSLSFTVNDHCEVFVDGRKAGYFRDGGTVTIAQKAKGGDRVRVALRVRNNYGKGGLVDARLSLKARQDDIAAAKTRLSEFLGLCSRDRKYFAPAIPFAESLADTLLSATSEPSAELTRRALDAAHGKRVKLETFFSRYPPITRGPWLQNSSPGTMTVMWETAVDADTRLFHGTDARRLREHRVPGKRTIHRARLTGLAPGAQYYYRVRSGYISSGTYSFTTEPRRAENFTFLVWGDSRTDTVAHEKVIHAMLGEKAAFAVNVGDVVGTGAREEWGVEHFTPIRKLARTMPTYIAIGNHEYFSMDEKGHVSWYDKYVDQPGNGYWYSFDYGNGHFIVLDTNKAIPADLHPESEQYRWLVKDLEGPASRRAAWRFVFMHHPLWTKGWSGEYYDGEPLLRERLRPLFEKHGVHMVFQGHTHDYEFGRLPKERGVAYVIAGGGGAPLDDTMYKEWEHVDRVEFKYHYCAVEVSGKKLRFRAVDTNGKVFDERVIDK